MSGKTLICYVAQVTDSPVKTAENLHAAVASIGGGFVLLSIHGYDDDPRDLIEIPEVRAWCRRFIEAGGLDSIPIIDDGPPETNGTALKDFNLLAIAGLPGAREDANHLVHFDLDEVARQRKKYSKAS